ncbi:MULTISPECIES: hypothetical protein [unclassified Roseofilum]|nr:MULTISPECIES: hypothetical protein [unclassified Roseofilum]MBP0008281.1 hypothetical protein [Roseofilum sp. Belize Diploria]MBP0032748.1 hypothetical protein [Roseofilum sp. Belize BBD 4]
MYHSTAFPKALYIRKFQKLLVLWAIAMASIDDPKRSIAMMAPVQIGR